MFFSKLSYGVAAAFIVVAGIVEVPLQTFFGWAALVAILHYGTMLFLGYFFGSYLGDTFVTILEHVPYVITGLCVFFIAYYYLKKYISKRLREAEDAVEKTDVA